MLTRPDHPTETFAGRSLIGALALLTGVTALSFVLTVQFGPDPVWERLGANPTSVEIEQARQALGQDRPLPARYLSYLHSLVTLDLGHSWRTGEPVRALLARTLPVSIALLLPGFLIGLVLALALAMVSAWQRGRWPERVLTNLSAASMSVSFVIVVIVGQAVAAGTTSGLPARGWSVDGPASYLQHIAIPTLALVVVNLGHNLRFFHAVLADGISAEHVRTARAWGATPARIMLAHVLPNAWLPIMTRTLFSLPLLVIAGSLVLESHFGIPGLGLLTYNAILAGDQPVIMAVVGLGGVSFALMQILSEWLSRRFDPRLP